MSDDKDPDFWRMMMDQTPPVLRYVFGLLTLWVFTVAGIIYRRRGADIDKLEQRQREDTQAIYKELREQEARNSQRHEEILRELSHLPHR